MQDVREPMEDRPEVALVLAYDASGRLLLGQRRDNGLWVMPGGHVEDDECSCCAAKRELREETGLAAFSMTPAAGVRENPPELPKLHVFTALVAGFPHGGLDPDREAAQWFFFDVSEGLDPEVYDALHGPPGELNVVRQFVRRGEESPIDDLPEESSIGDTTKSEDLAKMALRDIPQGQEVEPGTWSYDHVLPHGMHGYSLKVAHDPDTSNLTAYVEHEGREVGTARGYSNDVGGVSTIQPHIKVHVDHRGQGLGLAMYEALFAHARHMGVKMVIGGPHTDDAGRIHERLASKHGLGYSPDPHDEDYPSYDRGRYAYTLKSELDCLAKSDLLDHRDPRERQLAVLTQPLTRRHLLRAALDDDHDVRLAALRHPDMDGSLLRYLACARRLRSGQHPGRAVADYLAHPAATRGHAELARDAAAAHGPKAAEAGRIAEERLGWAS